MTADGKTEGLPGAGGPTGEPVDQQTDGSGEPLTQQSVGLTPEQAAAARQLARQHDAAKSPGTPGYVTRAVEGVAGMPPDLSGSQGGVSEPVEVTVAQDPAAREAATYRTGPPVVSDEGQTQPEIPAVTTTQPSPLDSGSQGPGQGSAGEQGGSSGPAQGPTGTGGPAGPASGGSR